MESQTEKLFCKSQTEKLIFKSHCQEGREQDTPPRRGGYMGLEAITGLCAQQQGQEARTGTSAPCDGS